MTVLESIGYKTLFVLPPVFFFFLFKCISYLLGVIFRAPREELEALMESSYLVSQECAHEPSPHPLMCLCMEGTRSWTFRRLRLGTT